MNKNKTTYLTKVQQVTKNIAIAALVLSAHPAYGESDKIASTRSISYLAESAPDKAESDSGLKETAFQLLPALVTEGYREESSPVYAARTIISYIEPSYTSAEVTLYDATTELISDFDHDGFYHRFRVTYDADTIYPEAYIFAELYLSYEGGPWNYIAAGDSYYIYGDSEQDTFTIETELAEGFAPGYYDIRIELYDADTGYRILSYGPYDDPSLSALPLEDSYDDDYVEVITPIETEVIISAAGHTHGSMGLWLLSIPLLTGLFRRFK
jgi:hypothetical protein